MTLRTSLAVMGLLTCLALPAMVLGQAELRKEVVAAGGGTASSVNHTMRLTLGQPAVGQVTDTTYDLNIGFWYGGVMSPSPVNDDIPIVFGMDQNYPNPFNPVTIISFSMPGSLPVNLSIYNVRGERVRVLVDEVRGAGRHEVVWDGDDDHGRGVSSGTYMIYLEAEGTIKTSKIMLVR
jgi:hypothetical protein